MELGHKHINFGNMRKNERREKTLVLKNLSEMPLLYRIRKSGSVASSASARARRANQRPIQLTTASGTSRPLAVR